jgi:hypothetical protein
MTLTIAALLSFVPTLRADVIDFEEFPALTWPTPTHCPAIRSVEAGLAIVSGGGLIQGFPGFRQTNTSKFYITSQECSGATPTFTITFSVPVSNVSLDLVPSVYEDDYISITDDTGNHQTALIPGSLALSRPMERVALACSGCTQITLTTLTLFYSFGIDNISYDPASVTLDFEINQNTPEAERRVLISKARADDRYPSAFQDHDGRIKIRIRSSIAQAGISVYLRVVDPPDPSPYMPQQNPPPAKDNLGPPGELSSSLAVTDSAGMAETELIVSQASGDNYQIEASIYSAIRKPTTPCGATCVKSGILTAWKRVYVEVHKAFRQGSFLTRDVAAGDTVIPVTDVSNFPKPPFRIRLIHAPPIYDGLRTDFYEDEVEVKHIFQTKDVKELHLRHPSAPMVGDTIARAYAGPAAPKHTLQPRFYLADAVGVVDGTASSYETVDTVLVAPLFEQAFVEVKWLEDDNLRDWTDPQYQRVIPRLPRVTYDEREWLSRKWIRHASPFGIQRIAFPNHQTLFLSDRSSGNRVRGEATVAAGFNDVWFYTGMIGNATLRSEALTHEMAHHWRVNHQWLIANPPPDRGPGGHCDTATGADRFIYNRPGLLCSMHELLYSGASYPGVADGIVGFHFISINGQDDSEYLRIRKRVDPVPQNENQWRLEN